MSTLECDDSVVSGDGDGLRRSYQKPSAKRTPVPSCRRFATRQTQVTDDQARIRLEQALTTLQKPPKTTPKTPKAPKTPRQEDLRHLQSRKRSKTMAEITPTKRKPVDPNLAGDGPTRPPPPKREEAARRVYQKLLLNSWRRRRTQVATLAESSAKLQAQVDQLQIQVDVLQKLRESEGRRRSESVCESNELRREGEELRLMALNINQDNQKLRDDIKTLEKMLAEVEAKNQSLKNELTNARCEYAISEKKVAKEKILNGSLRDENIQLQEKLSSCTKTADNLRQTVEKLKSELEVAEKNLEEARAKIINLQEDKWELIDKQKREIKLKNIANLQLVDEKEKRAQIERKLQELKKTILNLSGVKSKLIEDNATLKKNVDNLEHALAQEKAQKWWKNAATTIVDTLQSAATIMLPAFPRNHKSKSTSTTDLPPKEPNGK